MPRAAEDEKSGFELVLFEESEDNLGIVSNKKYNFPEPEWYLLAAGVAEGSYYQ